MSGIIFLILRLALAVALYAFLGFALYSLWRDLRLEARQAAVPQARPLALELPADPNPQTLRYTCPEVLIGRDPACNCTLEDLTLSARHARLAFHHGQWWVEDLHSTNGTFLNEESVKTPLVIAHGDRLRCGQVVLLVAMEEH